MKNENIRKDLFELYQMLYLLNQNEVGEQTFSDVISTKLKYEPIKVKKALGLDVEKPVKLQDNKKNAKPKIKQEILVIKTREQVEYYLNQNLLFACRYDITEKERNDILRQFSIDELKYLYEIVYETPFRGKSKKYDIVYRIKRFFDDSKRTRDLFNPR